MKGKKTISYLLSLFVGGTGILFVYAYMNDRFQVIALVLGLGLTFIASYNVLLMNKYLR